MKASLTLREDPKNPILKSKIPLNTLGVPFCAGIEAGDHDELCLSLGTTFCSGPLLKLCYRPNDSLRQFGLTLKTGVGKLGSPSSSPISVSAELDFVGNGRPDFRLQIKSRSGDFSVRRSESLVIQNGVAPGENLSWDQLLSGAFGVLSGGEVRARTSVTASRAAMKLGWSMRFRPPAAAAGDGGCVSRGEVLLREMPCLVLRKISIEHVEGDERREEERRVGEAGDVAEARFGLEELKLEAHYGGRSKNQIS